MGWPMDAREMEARQLINEGKVSLAYGFYAVRSQTDSKKYRVVLDGL